MEIWKDLEGYEGLYQISNFGNIKSLSKKFFNGNHDVVLKERLLKQSYCKDGYKKVCLCKNNKKKSYLIHRLVAKTFVKNPYCYYQVNHKDENKENNMAENLEWCDSKYNVNYGTRNYKISTNVSKGVLQFDLNNKLIKKWDSARKVCNELNFNYDYIMRACREEKSAYGYIWKYGKGEQL
jgi:hypothetical protein